MNKFLNMLSSPITMGVAIGANAILFGMGFLMGDPGIMAISGVSLGICYFAAHAGKKED